MRRSAAKPGAWRATALAPRTAAPARPRSTRITTSGSSTATRRPSRRRGRRRERVDAARWRARSTSGSGGAPGRAAGPGWRAGARPRASGRRAARSRRTARRTRRAARTPAARPVACRARRAARARPSPRSALALRAVASRSARAGAPERLLAARGASAACRGRCGRRPWSATPRRLSTSEVSARLSRSHVSCTASSASRQRAEHPVGHGAQMRRLASNTSTVTSFRRVSSTG